jgi:hypothetical protein
VVVFLVTLLVVVFLVTLLAAVVVVLVGVVVRGLPVLLALRRVGAMVVV